MLKRTRRLLKRNRLLVKLYRKAFMVPCTWRDVYDLTCKWARQLLNKDFDCIVGVPRSGLVVGSVLAEQLGLPLSTPESFVRNEVWFSGSGGSRMMRKVLVVDDGVHYGRDLLASVELIRSNVPDVTIETAALCRFGNKCGVDHVYLQDPKFATPPPIWG